MYKILVLFLTIYYLNKFVTISVKQRLVIKFNIIFTDNEVNFFYRFCLCLNLTK